MFKLHKVLSLSLVMFFGASSLLNIPSFNNEVYAATANIVKIDPSLQYQTMDGWGTSLAWWGKLVGDWETNSKNEIMDLAFDKDKGLGLNIVRYNIGGSTSPLDTNLRPGGDIESYLLQDGTYDWTKDEGQRWTLNEAKKIIENGGDKFISEAFSNSPPYFMTKSGQATGFDSSGSSNLDPAKYGQFADYLTEVVKHFNSDWGITFYTLAATNEPSSGYWKKGGNQEGCVFKTASEKNGMYQMMNQKIKDAQVTTKITGFDETDLSQSINSINNVQSATLDTINQLNTHVYSGSNSERIKLRDKAASLEKLLYMDEVCIGGPSVHDHNNMNNGLQLAQIIFNDLRYMKVPAWEIWQVADDEPMNANINSNWGIIHAYWEADQQSPNYEKYFLTKQYYAMAHFSKYIRPGYKIIDADSDDVVAAIDPTSKNLVLVTKNAGTNDKDLSFDISKFDTTQATVKAYRTTETESLADVSSGVSVVNGTLTDALPKNSMVTYVISNAKYSGEIGTVINDNVTGTDVNQFEYSDNTWGHYDAQSGAYSNDTHYNDGVNKHVNFKFNGNGVKIYGVREASAGVAGISIDNGAETNVDLYAKSRTDNTLIYESDVLQDGEHTVKIRITGNKNASSSGTWLSIDRSVALKNYTGAIEVQKPVLTDLISGGKSLRVNYKAVEGANSYNIKYGTTSGQYTNVINNITDTSCVITGVENGIKYYVAVSAVINGIESVNSNELSEIPVSPANPNLLYYVNCGDASPNVLENGEELGINNSNQDQVYGLDPITRSNWGYIADEGKQWSQDKEVEVGSNYGCLRQYDGNLSTGGLSYKFDVPNGKYRVTMGFNDPWSHDGRLEDILINGNYVAQKLSPTIIGKVPNNFIADVNNGILTVRAQRSPSATDKPIISWIQVTKIPVVSYNANGGEGTVPTDTNIYNAKDLVTVKANTLTKTGYNFVGWNTEANGTGTPYTENSTFSMGDSDVTLYAKWKGNTIVTAVDAISDMNVANGTTIDSIGLPTTVNIIIDGLSTTSAAVTWESGNHSYNGSIAGDYNFTGALGLANGIKNPNNLKATVKVRVREENEVPATAPASVELTRDDDTLTALLKNADGSNFTIDASVKYDWYRDSELVEGENSKNYNLSGIDKGTRIKVEVSQYGLISNIIDISNNSSPADGVIKPIKVRIEGIEKVGKTLEAQLLAINEVEFTTSSAVTYEWYRLSSGDSEDGTLVGNDKTYKLVGDDKGTYIKLVATYDGKAFEDITSKIGKKSSGSSSSSSESSSSNSSASNTGNSENSNSSNNESATINDGWKNNSDNTLKYIKNGQPTTGWNQIDGSWYLMDSTGTVQNGWKQADGIWYLLKNNGAMATGWQQTNDNWYFLKDSGAMATGWIQSEGVWYFLKDNGAMATGWQKSNDQWYYLYSNGSMASNTVIDNYRLAENGAWIN